MFEIRNIEELLEDEVGKDKKIISYKTKRLTAPGENYGSLILAVDVYLENTNLGKKEWLHLVAKLLPENEELKTFFQVEITFKKELEMYRSIAPALANFEKAHGLKSSATNIFPKFCGGRMNLNLEKNNLDDDAVILLENLKVSGFKTGERSIGFNLEETRLILKELAVFHATSIALSILNPGVFESCVKPHLGKISLFESTPKQQNVDLRKKIVEICNLDDECSKFSSRIEVSINKILDSIGKNQNCAVKNAFSSIIHCDLWVNNVMLKHENDKPTQVKFVDFQLYNYGLTGNDVVFLLLSSVQTQVVENYYNQLIKLYYDEFIKTLKRFECDLTPFDYNEFENNLKEAAKSVQIFHALRMLQPIYAGKNDVRELKDVKGSVYMISDVINEKHKEKAWFIIKMAADKGWI